MRILPLILAALLLPLSLRAQSRTAADPPSGPVRVSGSMMARQAVKRADAVYPSDSRSHPPGFEVELYALVGKDGAVEEADALSGPKDLSRTAIAAAKSWMFRPYLVNGSPVAVQTTITVGFAAASVMATPMPQAAAASWPAAAYAPPKDPVWGGHPVAQVQRASAVAGATSPAIQPAPRVADLVKPAPSLSLPSMPTQGKVVPVPGFARAAQSISAPRPLAIAMRASAVNHTPRTLIQKVAPVYPAQAVASELEGAVATEFTVRPDGTTGHLVVISGPPGLRQAAVDAVSQWKYAPTADSNGEEAMSTVISFTLDGPAKVPPDVMASRIEEHELPVYPPGALAAGVHGTVKMHALIGRQGQVERLDVVSGPEALRESAMDAVRLWRYQPYLRDGIDVEVATTIFVDFSLPAEAHLQ